MTSAWTLFIESRLVKDLVKDLVKGYFGESEEQA